MLTFRAVPVDSPAARDVLGGYFAERADGWPGPGVYAPTWPARAAFEAPDGVFLLAVVDGEQAGCGGVRRIASPIDDPEAVRFEIKHVWIRPEHRGGGHGRQLLEELERRARDLGATEVVLDTNRSLEAAGSLYARLGYTATEPYNDNPNATDWLRKAVV